jgi:hypothetical protein
MIHARVASHYLTTFLSSCAAHVRENLRAISSRQFPLPARRFGELSPDNVVRRPGIAVYPG